MKKKPGAQPRVHLHRHQARPTPSTSVGHGLESSRLSVGLDGVPLVESRADV